MITEAKEIILNIIKANMYIIYHITGYVDVYIGIGGEKDELLVIFTSYGNHDDHLYFHFVRLLMEDYPEPVTKSLLDGLYKSETSMESKVAIARYLAHLGNARGFAYLVEQVRVNKKSPFEIQGGLTVNKIKTAEALIELEKVIHLLVDKYYHNEKRFYESAKNIILEWVNAFAAKSEEDLEMVLAFFSEALNKYRDSYVEAMDLSFYMNRMVENFRGIDKGTKSIKEINTVLKQYAIA